MFMVTGHALTGALSNSSLVFQLIQVNLNKHFINETQVMEQQRLFSLGIKEQLLVMLQNVNDLNKRAHPP